MSTAAALLDAGIPVDALDRFERTPLHWAAIAGETKIVELLLAHGAALEGRAWYDMTPLHWAALAGRVAVVELLLERGADVRAQNFYGMTPLHLAGDAKVVRALIAAQANIEAVDESGMTPMHFAYTEAVAQALIDAGANIFARAQDGRQPITMSVAGNPKIPWLVVYPDRDRVRLRGAHAEVKMLVRSLVAQPILEVKAEVQAQALDVSVTPESLPVLNPAQMVPFRITLTRRPGVIADKTRVAIRVMETSRRELATLNLEVDARPEETPEDTGHVRVTAVEMRATPDRLQYLAYAGAPSLLFVFWLVTRWRQRRAALAADTAARDDAE